MILRFLKYIEFHPLLSLTSVTIGRSLNDLFHFAVVYIIAEFCFMFVGHINFGPIFGVLSTIDSSMQRINEDVFFGGQLAELYYHNMDMNIALDICSLIMVVLAPIILFFILLNFVLGILGDAFGESKEELAEVQEEQGDLHVMTDVAKIVSYNFRSLQEGWGIDGVERNINMLLVDNLPPEEEEEAEAPPAVVLPALEQPVLDLDEAQRVLQDAGTRVHSAERDNSNNDPVQVEQLAKFLVTELMGPRPEEEDDEEAEEEEEEGDEDDYGSDQDVDQPSWGAVPLKLRRATIRSLTGANLTDLLETHGTE